MAETYDFDVVNRLEPDAVGLPGHRRFRLIVENENRTAFLWMEKEQLQALGLAVDQMLTPIKPVWSNTQAPALEPAAPHVESGSANVEVQVGRMGLGYDENAKLFIIVAHDASSDSDEAPTFRCLVSRATLSGLSDKISTITAAGRTRCPLCGQPLDNGPHFCPGSNGHSKHE